MDIGKISSAGVGSGLDVATIVSQLLAIEKRPLELLQQDAAKLNTQLSTYGKLQSSFTDLRDAARKLTDSSTWTPVTVASSDAAAVNAIGGAGAVPGSYSVSVSTLAAAQSIVGSAVADAAAAFGSGSLTIELGAWDAGQTGFTARTPAATVTVTIAPGSDSLKAIRDQINAAGAGVTASIVNDATGARLAIRSTDSGEANGFRITVTDDDGNGSDAAGLSRLAYDPSGGGSVMTLAQAAANAQATINGIAITSASNTLTDVLDGLTVQLSRVTTGTVSLAVQPDTETIRASITDFVTKYNALVTLMREQTKYDPASKTAGALQGDGTAVGLLGRLRTMVGSSTAAATAFTRLADVGLTPQRDGTIAVDDAKLTSALANLPELRAFFSRNDSDDANDGFGTLLRTMADSTLGSDGALATRQDGLRSRLDRNEDRQNQLEDRLALTEQRLRAQYTRLDESMGKLNALSSYIQQQITSWNRSSDDK
jgi:flagellar hook-associated protein 2